MVQSTLFYIFSLILILASLMVITARNPVHSILFLVLAFLAAAPIWMMLEAEFLALILILVYVGAVMTLFLFVVMMLNLDLAPGKAGYVRYLPFGLLVVGMITAAILYVVGPSHFGLTNMPAPIPKPATYSNTAELGMQLYTQYVYPFELAAVLLLIAIIAAISLSLRKSRSKKQNVSQQLHVERHKRVELIKMPVEKS